MCFTETFLKPHQHVEHNHLPIQDECQVFRLDRLQTNNEDLAKGGIMIVCSRSLQPIRINLQHHHPPQLEVVSIVATSTHSGCRMCIMAVYRRPNQPLTAFLPLLNHYVSNLPQIMPTIILGDFNENLLSPSPSPLLQLMSSRRFYQLVQGPTTDSGSLLDHIYCNGAVNDALIDVVDTYYSDHDATYLSLPL